MTGDTRCVTMVTTCYSYAHFFFVSIYSFDCGFSENIGWMITLWPVRIILLFKIQAKALVIFCRWYQGSTNQDQSVYSDPIPQLSSNYLLDWFTLARNIISFNPSSISYQKMTKLSSACEYRSLNYNECQIIAIRNLIPLAIQPESLRHVLIVRKLCKHKNSPSSALGCLSYLWMNS